MTKPSISPCGCAAYIRDAMRRRGTDCTVTAVPPAVFTAFSAAITCPHGATLYAEPTGDQIAQWARDGVR